MSDTPGTIRSRFFGPFLWVVTGAGSLAFLYSLTQLNVAQFDSRFVILVAMALLLASQITVPIPRLSSQISVSDTFVFLLLLLYETDRKSTRLNSSHSQISYAVFCLKKKKKTKN